MGEVTVDSETEKLITATGRKFKSYMCDFSNRSDLYSFIKLRRPLLSQNGMQCVNVQPLAKSFRLNQVEKTS